MLQGLRCKTNHIRQDQPFETDCGRIGAKETTRGNEKKSWATYDTRIVPEPGYAGGDNFNEVSLE